MISSSSFCFFELVFFKGFLVVGRLESSFLLTFRANSNQYQQLMESLVANTVSVQNLAQSWKGE